MQILKERVMKPLAYIFSLLILLVASPVVQSADLIDVLNQAVSQDNKYGNPTLSPTERDNFIKEMEIIYKIGTREFPYNIPAFREDYDLNGYTPDKVKELYAENAKKLVDDGYAKHQHFTDVYLVKFQEQLDLFQDPNQYPGILDRDDPLPDIDPKDFWWPRYRSVFIAYLDAIKNDPQTCAGPDVLRGNRKCCKGAPQVPYGYLQLPFVKKINKNNCAQKDAICTDHSQCCSGVCYRDNNTQQGVCADPNAKRVGEVCTDDNECLSKQCEAAEIFGTEKTCMPMTQCYELAQIDQLCTGNKPYCAKGKCYKIDKGSLGSNACIRNEQACTNNDECCSDLCQGNKCVENAICSKCAEGGQTPKNGQECCPGFYKSSTTQKCRHKYNPLSPICKHPGGECQKDLDCCNGTCGANNKCSSFNTLRKKEERTKESPLFKAFQLALNFVIPSAHAEEFTCEDGTPLNPQQIETLNNKKAECDALPENTEEERNFKNRCLLGLNGQRLALCGDSSIPLSPDNQRIIDTMKQECANKYQPDTPEMETCLKQVRLKEIELRQQQAGGENRYDNYINEYNAPTLSNKTYTDVYKCEFHSFNDAWRAAGNAERNAELFLRSFEFVFSGEGTKDYWIEQGNDKSIFERARVVAKSVREERSNFIKVTNEIDRKSNCYCLLVFGVSTFPTNKQTYFNNYCADIAAEFANDAATNGQDKSAIDGTAINSDNTQEVNRAKTETIDKGAIGISYEKALTRYIDFVATADMDRFTNFEEHEAELSAMSNYLINTDFQEVWKPTLESYGVDKYAKGNNPYEGDSRELYTWGRRYMNGFFSVLTAIVTLGITAMTGDAFSSNRPVEDQDVTWSGISAAYGTTWPDVVDHREKRKETYNMFMNYDAYRRHYIGPRFTNRENKQKGAQPANATDAKRCSVLGRASACLKSAYSFNPGSLKYLLDLPEVGHYIVDPKKPPFVTSSLSLEKMPGYNQTWVQIVNETVNEGFNWIKGNTSPYQLDGRRVKSKDGYSGITRNASNYRKKNVFLLAVQDKKHFIPKKDTLKATRFDNNLKNSIINAAKKYALCKDLVPADTTDAAEAEARAAAVVARIQAIPAQVPPGLQEALVEKFKQLIIQEKGEQVNGCYGAVGTVAGDVGYGYLFESEQEAQEWAEYTYEMHYIYSSITKNKYMGYPLVGQNVYFEAVFNKMKLLRTMWAQRATESFNVRNLYQNDLNKRAGAYQSLGEATNGTNSRNISGGYGNDFLATFKMLNFDGTTDIEAFNAAVEAGKAANKFNSRELAALGAGANSAARLNKKLAEASAFEKDMAALGKGSKLLNNNVRDNLINPIGAISAANPGGAFAGGSALGAKLNAINDKLAALDKNQRKDKGKNKYKSPFGDMNMPSFNNSSGGYNSSISSEPDYSKADKTTKSGMSDQDASRLIRQLNKNKDLTERLANDTLFTIVSKAYKRNYGRILLKNKKSVKEATAKEDVTDKQKAVLKKLMEDN